MEYRWPKVFTDPDFEYPPGEHAVALALGNGLEGWGLAMLAKAPEGFGMGMVKISLIAECGPTVEEMSARADELGLLKGTP